MALRYDYSVTPGDRLGRPLAKELAALFSSAYGKWSRRSPVNPGGRIRLGAGYYLANYANPLFRVATCRAGSRLIAQAVYLECDTPRGKVSLVVQLVVDAEFRRQGVATTLLHAIWGFSDFYAWGIVTSSPCTVEALEAATFRRSNAGLISRRAAFVAREVLARVPFLASAPWRTLRFETETVGVKDFQGTSVVNYTEAEIPYTRIHEFKHYHPELADVMAKPKTVVMREYSAQWKPGDEPYYPVDCEESRALLAKYRAEAENIPNLVVGGRLGGYRYFDMDQTIAAALALHI